MKSAVFALTLFPLVWSGVGATELYLEQNFDSSPFTPGELTGGGGDSRSRGGEFRSEAPPGGLEIVTEPVRSAPHALKLTRNGTFGDLRLWRDEAVKEGYDFRFYFSVWIGAQGQGAILFDDCEGNNFPGAVLIQNSRIFGWDGSKKWAHASGLEIKPEAWNELVVDFSPNEKNYRVGIVDADGREHYAPMLYPLHGSGRLRGLRLTRQLPENNSYYLDELRIEVDDEPSTRGRKNVADQARISLSGERRPDIGTLCVDDPAAKAVIEPAAGRNLLEFEFVQNVTISGAVIISGEDDGSRALGAFRLYALNALGHRTLLGERAGGNRVVLEFKPEEKVTKLQLELLESSPVTLRGFRFLTPPGEGVHLLDERFGAMVSGEFRLPVYDGQYPTQRTANLLVVNHRSEALPVVVTLTERGSGKSVIPERHLELAPGENQLAFELASLPNGEYIATVADAAADAAGKRGSIRRLLRHATAPECAVAPPHRADGLKLFFPDDFYLASRRGLVIRPGVTKRYPVVIGTPDDDAFIVFGYRMELGKDGRIRIGYNTLNRQWKAASKRPWVATEKNLEAGEWEVTPGEFPAGEYAGNPLQAELPAAARPDWSPKPVNGQLHYRFYDPELDGPVNLRQVKVVWVTPTRPDEDGYTDYDWQVMRPPHSSTWPLWYRENGEVLILRKTPLVYSQNDGSGFENSDSGSDLGFGQWLSDDGKYLHYAQGRHLKRFEPCTAPFDNINDLARIVAVWRTADGINWERAYIGVPGVEDPVADQHYGGVVTRLPRGGGLRLAFMNDYDALHQQMKVVLVYSWDGFRWTRFHGAPPFVGNGEPDDWRRGGGYPSDRFVERDGKYYMLLKWNNNHYHFQSEVVHYLHASADVLTADYMRRKFEPRRLAEWPYFQPLFGGSWERLAEHTRQAVTSVGIAEIRKDGWFALTALPGESGEFETVPFEASGRLVANLRIGDRGSAVFRLIGEDGAVMAEKKFDGDVDGTEITLFDRLPAGRFRVRGELQEAELYTLEFLP